MSVLALAEALLAELASPPPPIVPRDKPKGCPAGQASALVSTAVPGTTGTVGTRWDIGLNREFPLQRSGTSQRYKARIIDCQHLADVHRREIEEALDHLPSPCCGTGVRLLDMTRTFLASKWFDQSIELGWPLHELFGVSPHAPFGRVGEQGLVTGLALSPHQGGRLAEITEDHAVIEYPSGSTLTYRRLMPAMDAAVLWWECAGLIGP